MTAENQYTDQKSLRVISGKTADWPELAKEDCVCFANSQGGRGYLSVLKRMKFCRRLGR